MRNERSNSANTKFRKERNALVPFDYAALAEFRYQLRLFLAISERNVKKAGLTSQQYQALLTITGLSAEGKMSVGELAQLMLIKHHSAAELIERLVKSKLIEKTVDPADKRRVIAAPTRLGSIQLNHVAAENIKYLKSSRPNLLKALRSFRSGK